MNYKNLILALCFMVVLSCKKQHAQTDLTKEVVIPKPISVTATGSAFELTNESHIFIKDNSVALLKIGETLAANLKALTGYSIKVSTSNKQQEFGNIHLTLANNKKLGDEGYILTISEASIELTAMKPAGLFMGIQTIRQLLPIKIASDARQGPWEISTGIITDYPTYAYRGSMLDVSRHFFSVEDVKRYIDLISLYKMNVMHLHLSDDQGWRIEIKSWPNLTTHGGSTQVGGGRGGFYTQDQYKDIVKYAQDRYITIIPEIDMPGHTNAALASYPELNCNDKTPALYTGTSVGFSTLCASKEVTYKFVDDVIRELAAITPGPYIHIGGDESHATKKEDYITIINKVQNIVKAHGKQMIGWEETSQAILQPNSVAQFWANEVFAKAAVSQGAKIIMSLSKKIYLDMSYDSTTKLGLHWAAYIELDSAYQWDPAKLVKGIGKENILGIEAPLWTETITNIDEIEYMVFPRIIGYAEIGWSNTNNRNWEEYKVRLGKQAQFLKAQDINFYKSKLVPWEE